MAQRWMQAKDQLAKKHGKTASGCTRPMGDVMDDRLIGRTYAEPKAPPKRQRRNVVLKANRPKAWAYTGADPYAC
jgi:hypothetical protein